MDPYTGTKPIDERHSFDIAKLQAFLESKLDGFRGPVQVEQFKGGQSNPTYKLVTQRASYVMRAKPGPVSRLLPSAHAIEREYIVLQALRGTPVPVPHMHLLCEDESVIGRAFYIMEFVQGRVLWDQRLLEMDKSERGAIYDEMNRVIAALHSIDPVTVGLEQFGKQGNYFERQIARWSKQYLASVTDPIQEMEFLIDWLPAHMASSARDPREVSIVHGDFRLDNLVFHPTEPRVLAVLDWELSTIGHPLADISYHCLSWNLPLSTGRGFSDLDIASLGIPDERAHVARYCERTGRADPKAVMADWNFYVAYNIFRLAAILQGIAKRALDGTASSAQAQQVAAGARPLALLAWRVARAADT